MTVRNDSWIKKLLSCCLALVLVISLTPSAAFAVEADGDQGSGLSAAAVDEPNVSGQEGDAAEPVADSSDDNDTDGVASDSGTVSSEDPDASSGEGSNVETSEDPSVGSNEDSNAGSSEEPDQAASDASEDSVQPLSEEGAIAGELSVAAAPAATAAANDYSKVRLAASSHVQYVGWKQVSSSSLTQQLTLGTTGQSLRLEAVTLSLQSVGSLGGIQYTAHVQDYGWMSSKANGATAGTTGKSKSIEAIQIKLTGAIANDYDIYYRVHAQDYGWLGWAKNGGNAGTEGLSKRAEALQVQIVKKGETPSGYNTSTAFYAKQISGSGHSQYIGWLSTYTTSLTSSITLGTTGQSKQLEAISISLPGVGSQGGIQYRAHAQDYGWMDWKSNGATAGTTGQSKRLEAVQIRLTGNLANQYDVYYRGHAANIGWLGWTKNGEIAGTEGASVSLEAVQVVLVKKGASAPGSTECAYLNASSLPITVSCGSLSSKANAWSSVGLAQTAGTTGQSRALLGMSLTASSSAASGGITYSAHFAWAGWSSFASNGAKLQNGSNGIQAIRINLTGNLAKYFDVYYRVHIANYGWAGWAANGAYAGTTGLSRNIEAYQVKVVVKGAPAPGSTANSYSGPNGFLGVKDSNSPYLSKAQGYSSGTRYLIFVDRAAHRVVVFEGSRNNWRVKYNWSCVTGAPGTPTITGNFMTTGFKRTSLSTDRRAIWCTQISGGYFFHSILASESELGKSLSHGCIRLAYANASWIYNNVGAGTRVVIW